MDFVGIGNAESGTVALRLEAFDLPVAESTRFGDGDEGLVGQAALSIVNELNTTAGSVTYKTLKCILLQKIFVLVVVVSNGRKGMNLVRKPSSSGRKRMFSHESHGMV